MNIKDFESLFDLCQDIISIVDRDHCVVAVNDACCRYMGKERDAVIGCTVESVLGSHMYNSAIRKSLKRSLGGETVSLDRWFDFSLWGRRFMSTSYSPYKNDAGEIVGAIVISRDLTEQKKLEDEVTRQKNKMDAVVSSIGVGLVLLNRDLTVDWVNEQILRDFPVDDPIGQPCYKAFNNYESPCKNCDAKKTFASGEICRVERFDRRRGRWFSKVSEAVRDEEGNILQVLLQVTDVTERKQAEERLRDRQAELAGIFRAARVGICEMRDRQFVQVNDFFCHMVGRSREELLGYDSSILYECESDYETVGQKVYDNMQAESIQSMEIRWVRGDGSPLDVLVSLTPLYGDDISKGVTLVAMDITERNKAEAILRESEVRFRSLFEDVHMIAVQGYDKDHRVIYWNPASEQLYGYTAEEALGNSLEDLIIPEPMRLPVWEGIEAWLKDGVMIPAGELELRHKDGSPVPVYSSHVMQETASGEQFMYCIDIDLGEIKRIHSELVQAKDQAEQANLAKSEFLANMSHEIRTPLNGIMGMFSLLQNAELGGNMDEYAQAGLESARRLNRLLGDILDLSKVEAGKLGLVKEPFDLPNMVAQVDDFFRYTSLNAESMLRCRVDPAVPKCVVGDAVRLQQVLTNLVGNGLKFTHNGNVSLDVSLLQKTENRGCRVLFTVSDTGIGMPDEVLDKLFDSFTQGSTGINRQYEGAGLGLSICRRLVGLMGGNMAVVSEEGRGTEIYFSLPFAVETEMTEDLVCEFESNLLTGTKVLLVEDERVNSVVARRMMEKMGCVVDCVGNGQLALEAVSANEFDVVFMDVQMPVMDGLEATRNLRDGKAGEHNRDIPIIAMTAHAMVGDKERFLEVGMNDYIAKPVESDELRLMLYRYRGE